ncbi:MAG: methylmalonyl Co-A mutase-associated GTPase MeaB, partial [Bacteroidetes bacterium]|nr:methylmalonyl Co-A mutase-associated GTPase MeaB [Bacteroidota bacterium]
MTIDEYTSLIEAGNGHQIDKRSLGKLLSLVENEQKGSKTLLKTLHRQAGRAYRIGVTGPPGAGKSTLVSGLVELLAREAKVGVVAVDPTSPFSGGAVLGDRFRMNEVAQHSSVFIRSVASRGSAGGLSRTAYRLADVMDACGYDFILFETVGVGQAEIEITEHADTTIVVLVPESGDGIQAMKAGLMEIADLFVINKSDRDQADTIKREIENILELRTIEETGWKPPVLKTIGTQKQGIQELANGIQDHRNHMVSTGVLDTRRKNRIRHEMMTLLRER